MKLNIKVDDRTITQSTLLHDDIPGYNLPTLEFVLPPVNDYEDLILEEENPEIYMHLENVLVHVINAQDVAIFKSQKDYVRNKKNFWNIYIIHKCVKSCQSYSPMQLYIRHYACDNTDHILYKIPKDNASYACGIYNYKHE